MFRTYQWKDKGQVERVQELDEAKRNLDAAGVPTWVDVAGGSLDDARVLDDLFGIPGEAIEDAYEGEQRPRLDEFDEAVFLLLFAALAPGSDNSFRPRKTCFYYRPGLLITLHTESLRTFDNMHARLKRARSRRVEGGLEGLFFHLVDSIVDNYNICTTHYEDLLDDIEEASLEEHAGPEVLGQLSGIRHDLLVLRRQLSALHEALAPFATEGYDAFSEALTPRFAHVRDHVRAAQDRIENSREIMQAIRDNVAAQSAQRTNRIMQTLTLITIVFLPLSLITGFYGMNVVLYPDPARPLSTLFVMSLMLGSVAVMLVYFVRKHWW